MFEHSVYDLQDLRALLLIYQSQPPTEYDPYVASTFTTLKSLCMEYKSRLHKHIGDTLTMLTARVQDSQKVPESEPLSKKRKLALPSTSSDEVVGVCCLRVLPPCLFILELNIWNLVSSFLKAAP